MKKKSYQEKLSELQKVVEAEAILEKFKEKTVTDTYEELQEIEYASRTIFEYEDREKTEQLKIQYQGILQGLTLAISIAALVVTIIT